MHRERYSRNEALFGRDGQEKIRATRVVICGLGGLGSHVAQQLAYLGVAQFALVDFDVVTPSSMNRLIGAADADAAAGTKKVEVAERMIRGISPNAATVAIDAHVNAPVAEEALSASDLVFGCLDRELPRLQLTALSATHGKPYFDLASDTGTSGDEPWFGGRIVFSGGNGCLVCLGLLDQDEIALESMTPDEREIQDRIYGVERDSLAGTGPAVVSVNGAVASLAVTEFIVFVTGLRDPVRHLIYHGNVPVLRRSADEPAPDCYYCRSVWPSKARPARSERS